MALSYPLARDYPLWPEGRVALKPCSKNLYSPSLFGQDGWTVLFFLKFMDFNSISVHKDAKKTSLVNNPYTYLDHLGEQRSIKYVTVIEIGGSNVFRRRPKHPQKIICVVEATLQRYHRRMHTDFPLSLQNGWISRL